jgi:hypothetical protein
MIPFIYSSYQAEAIASAQKSSGCYKKDLVFSVICSGFFCVCQSSQFYYFEDAAGRLDNQSSDCSTIFPTLTVLTSPPRLSSFLILAIRTWHHQVALGGATVDNANAQGPEVLDRAFK